MEGMDIVAAIHSFVTSLLSACWMHRAGDSRWAGTLACAWALREQPPLARTLTEKRIP